MSYCVWAVTRVCLTELLCTYADVRSSYAVAVCLHGLYIYLCLYAKTNCWCLEFIYALSWAVTWMTNLYLHRVSMAWRYFPDTNQITGKCNDGDIITSKHPESSMVLVRRAFALFVPCESNPWHEGAYRVVSHSTCTPAGMGSIRTCTYVIIWKNNTEYQNERTVDSCVTVLENGCIARNKTWSTYLCCRAARAKYHDYWIKVHNRHMVTSATETEPCSLAALICPTENS
jgi:hypothetical protein